MLELYDGCISCLLNYNFLLWIRAHIKCKTVHALHHTCTLHFHIAKEKKRCAGLITFPRSSCRPRIWARKTPVPMKILGTRPRKPRRFFGAISPKYIGTTLKEIPASAKRHFFFLTFFKLKKKKSIIRNQIVNVVLHCICTSQLSNSIYNTHSNQQVLTEIKYNKIKIHHYCQFPWHIDFLQSILI